jgi:hypothetical protein
MKSENGLKSCSRKKCEQNNPQPVSHFAVERANPDGLCYACKVCKNRGTRAWRDDPDNHLVLLETKRKKYEEQAEQRRAEAAQYRRENPVKYAFTYYKHGAMARNLEFDLSFEEFGILVIGECFYCGLPATEAKQNGIDRVDNDGGYFLDNCVPCCRQCNIMKMDYSYDEFIEHLCRIANNLWFNTNHFVRKDDNKESA